MINWNLGGEGLMHCLNISKAKLLVCDEQADLRDRIEGVQNEISANRIRLEFLDGTLKGAIAQGDGNRPRDELRRGFTRTSPMALIYTRSAFRPFCRLTVAQQVWKLADNEREV